jgi:peptidoglycan/LPS O-acetylase OafA/YrhL
MPSSRRVGGLDVLRGAAVALVVLRHAWPGTFPGAGTVGVTVFFTLSGYLITGVVQREVLRTGSLSFRAFYRNRALRLGPALALLLVVFAAVEATAAPLGHPERVPLTVAVAALYLADVPRLPLVGLGHLWTLAVEEQFYLVWPAALVLAVRRARVTALLSIALGGWLVACTASVLVAPGGPASVYSLPTTWAVTLLAGAALALRADRLPRVPGPVAGSAVAVLVALSLAPLSKDHATTYLLGGPVVALATCVLIHFAVAGWRVPAAAAPLRLLGTVSYATYLWNYLVVQWLQAVLGAGSAASWLSLPLSVGAAALSWRLVERPALRWKERLAAGAPAVVDLREVNDRSPVPPARRPSAPPASRRAR